MGGDNVYGDCLGRYSATPDADCDELGVPGNDRVAMVTVLT